MFFDITSNINNTLDLLQAHKNIFDQNNINISVEFLLNKNLLEKLCQCYPNKLIKISTVPNHLIDDLEYSEVFDKKSLKILLENVEYMQKKYNNQFVFKEGFSIQEAIIASKKVNDWVDEINNAKINNEKLSPLEKYLYAYQICTDFYYNESNEKLGKSRFLFGVLNSDNIVCVGYAGLLTELCNRLDIPCVRQQVKINNSGYHLNCCVSIDDEKYNIHGIYYSDPCWDCIGKYSPPTLKNSLIPYDDVDKIHHDIKILNKTNCLTKVTCKKEEEAIYKKVLEYYNNLRGYEKISEFLKDFIDQLDNNTYKQTPAYKYVKETIDSIIIECLEDKKEVLTSKPNNDIDTNSLKTAIMMLISANFEDFFAKDANKNNKSKVIPDKIYLEKTISSLNYSISSLLSQGLGKDKINNLANQFFNKELIEEQVLDLYSYYTKLKNRKELTEKNKLKSYIKSKAYRLAKNSSYIDIDTIHKALIAIEKSKETNENKAKLKAKSKLESSIFSAYINNFADCNCDYAFVQGAKNYKKKKDELKKEILDDNLSTQK